MSSSSLCVSCSMQFTLFKRKNRCPGCRMLYCSQCFKKGENLPRRNVKQCLKCHALSSPPFIRSELMLLSVKELKAFLELKNVSATGCTEKSDLVDVIINHQARPQVNTTYAREAHASAQTSTPTASSQAHSQSNRNTQHASQGTNNFFGLQIHPEIHRFVGSLFQMDESGANGLRPPSRDELNSSQRTSNEYQPSRYNQNHQFHMPWSMEFEPPVTFPPSQVATQTNAISLDSLKNANDIRELSIKELKSLLDHNFVDYKGCVEKEELIQRALKLWEESRRQHNAPTASSTETPGGGNEVCKVCMDRIIDCVFLECGHLVTCVDCGRRLNECPLCRQNIARIVKVFKS